MSNNNVSSSSSSGIGFFGLLTIVFITLKLTGFINWSWIWVLSPLWISFLLFIALILFIFVILPLGVAGIAYGVEKYDRWKREIGRPKTRQLDKGTLSIIDYEEDFETRRSYR